MSRKKNNEMKDRTVNIPIDLHKKIRLRSAIEDIRIKDVVKAYLEKGLKNIKKNKKGDG